MQDRSSRWLLVTGVCCLVGFAFAVGAETPGPPDRVVIERHYSAPGDVPAASATPAQLHHATIRARGCPTSQEERVLRIAKLRSYPSRVPHPNGGSYLDALLRCDVDVLDVTTDYDEDAWAHEMDTLKAMALTHACNDLEECADEIAEACAEKPDDKGGASKGCSAALEEGGCKGTCCDGWGVTITCIIVDVGSLLPRRR